MTYKGIKYYTYEELRTTAEKMLLKDNKFTFNKAQIGKCLSDLGYFKRRIQINGLRKLYYFKLANTLIGNKKINY